MNWEVREQHHNDMRTSQKTHLNHVSDIFVKEAEVQNISDSLQVGRAVVIIWRPEEGENDEYS